MWYTQTLVSLAYCSIYAPVHDIGHFVDVVRCAANFLTKFANLIRDLLHVWYTWNTYIVRISINTQDQVEVEVLILNRILYGEVYLMDSINF